MWQKFMTRGELLDPNETNGTFAAFIQSKRGIVVLGTNVEVNQIMAAKKSSKRSNSIDENRLDFQAGELQCKKHRRL